jgi:hypothetical protein
MADNMSPMKFRELRGKFFTVRQEAVEPCGHPLGANDEPTMRNCQHCWYAYFSQHTDLVIATGKVLDVGGTVAIDRIRGTKFRVMFQRFMKTLERLKEVTDVATADSD